MRRQGSAALRFTSCAIGVGLALALGAAGLVKAQDEPATAPTPPGAPKAAVKPHDPAAVANPAIPPAEPDAVAPAAPLDEASDATGDDDNSPSARPAPIRPTEPLKRPRYAIAVIQALDKVSAETLRFEAPINQPIRYKSLVFIVRACETNAPDEAVTEAAAHVEILSQPEGPNNKLVAGKQVFRGWMFSNSPGLNLFQHPVYDAWLIACKTATPSA